MVSLFAFAALVTSAAAGPAHALPVLHRVDFLVTGGESRIGSVTTPIAGGETFSGELALDAALLAADGSHDVTSSLSLPRAQMAPTPAPDYTAQAVVSGGAVVDLLLDQAIFEVFTGPFGDTSRSFTFEAAGGAFTITTATSPPPGLGSSSSTLLEGTFAVQTVPEPALLPLGAAALALSAAGARRRAR